MGDSRGFGGSTGVTGVASLARWASRFFSAVRRKTLIVVRSALLGLQSSADRGECSQIGHDEGSDDWPGKGRVSQSVTLPTEQQTSESLHDSQIACSQHGRRNAFTANLLQIAHRSLMGMSSGLKELSEQQQCQPPELPTSHSSFPRASSFRTHLISSACASDMDDAMSI